MAIKEERQRKGKFNFLLTKFYTNSLNPYIVQLTNYYINFYKWEKWSSFVLKRIKKTYSKSDV